MLNKIRNPKLILSCGIFIFGVLLIASLIGLHRHGVSKNNKSIPPVVYASASQNTSNESGDFNRVMSIDKLEQLEKVLADVKDNSAQQYETILQQLEEIKKSFPALASAGDIQKLQDYFSKPNVVLLSKIDDLHKQIQKIIQQTSQEQFVNPETVERYFRLAAVQGFSDGMRAVIDVDDNQTVLSINEVCPACHGWLLKRLDFANQSAVFEKNQNNQIFYAELKAD